MSNWESEFDQPVDLPINGDLDLHAFAPSDVHQLIPAYIDACRQRGISQIRIVHGKGTGTLRETTHAVLRRNPFVIGFHLGNETNGSWGATVVTLRG